MSKLKVAPFEVRRQRALVDGYPNGTVPLSMPQTGDPVDAGEELRNDEIYGLYQTNRNPFLDHPEWVDLTFVPAHTNRLELSVALAQGGVMLSWLATNQSARLEYATNLPAVWQDAPVMPGLSNGRFVVRWTNAVPRVLFRLRAR